jgi:hypothetical protein
MVWITEPVVINIPIGGPPPVSISVVIDFGEKVAAGVVTVSVLAGAKKALSVLRQHFWAGRHLSVTVKGKHEAVYDLSGPDVDTDAAIDAIPADYETVVDSKRIWRRWNDGRWEYIDIVKRSGREPPAEP